MTWPSVFFGEVFDIQLGKMLDRKKNRGELRPYLANKDVQWGRCDLSDLGEMRFTGADRKKFDLREGDLLVCEGGEVGRTAVWHGELSGCYYQKAIHRLRPTADVDPRFVLHYMRWAADRNLFARLTSATSIAHLTKTKLRRLRLPLPPLKEQKRLAGILDAADAVRTKGRESLAQLDTLLQSTFLDMFGDLVTNPRGWDMSALGDVATLQRGFDLPVQRRREGTVPILAANGPVGTHDEPKVVGPGVVTGRSGTLGKVRYVREDFWPLNTALWVKDFHGNDPLWVCFLLRQMRLEQFTRGAGVPTLNRNLVHVVNVPIPPLQLQARFAAVVESVQQQEDRQHAHLAELDTLFASLQSRAFNGEL